LEGIFYLSIFAGERSLADSVGQERNDIFLDCISVKEFMKIISLLHEIVLGEMLGICLDKFWNESIIRFELFDFLVLRCYCFHIHFYMIAENFFLEFSVVKGIILISGKFIKIYVQVHIRMLYKSVSLICDLIVNILIHHSDCKFGMFFTVVLEASSFTHFQLDFISHFSLIVKEEESCRFEELFCILLSKNCVILRNFIQPIFIDDLDCDTHGVFEVIKFF